jgi:hypothetical protein
MALKTGELLSQLEERCRGRGIKLIYADIQSEGGHCRLRDCWYVIINRRTAAATRARIINDALARIEAEASRPASAEAGTPGAPAREEAPALIKEEARP